MHLIDLNHGGVNLYNDFYLNSIDSKMSANNTLLNQIIEQNNVFSDKITDFCKCMNIWCSFLLLFVVALFLYHYFHTIFKVKGR